MAVWQNYDVGYNAYDVSWDGIAFSVSSFSLFVGGDLSSIKLETDYSIAPNIQNYTKGYAWKYHEVEFSVYDVEWRGYHLVSDTEKIKLETDYQIATNTAKEDIILNKLRKI